MSSRSVVNVKKIKQSEEFFRNPVFFQKNKSLLVCELVLNVKSPPPPPLKFKMLTKPYLYLNLNQMLKLFYFSEKSRLSSYSFHIKCKYLEFANFYSNDILAHFIGLRHYAKIFC